VKTLNSAGVLITPLFCADRKLYLGRMLSRNRPGKLSLLLLFVCIFAFWWGIAVLTQNSAAPGTEQAPVGSTNTIPQGVSGPIGVDISISNNRYTYSGSVPLVSSCDELGEGIAVHGEDPAHVTILLTLVRQSACAEAAGGGTEEPFSVSVSASAGAKVMLDGLTVNGVIVPTTVKNTGTQ
jgi:hypothetical protein